MAVVVEVGGLRLQMASVTTHHSQLFNRCLLWWCVSQCGCKKHLAAIHLLLPDNPQHMLCLCLWLPVNAVAVCRQLRVRMLVLRSSPPLLDASLTVSWLLRVLFAASLTLPLASVCVSAVVQLF